MTLLELKNLVAYWLDDLNFGYFTEAQVTVWLNNAQQEVQKRLIKAAQNYYTKCVQTTLVVNQNSYALPEDFRKEHRLEVILSGTIPNESSVTLNPITMNQQDLVQNGVGTPGWYFISRNKIILQPAPDTALTLKLVYSYRVANMVLNSDVPDVPAHYHELIGLLAAQDGFLKDGRVNDLLLKKIATYEKDMDQDAVERNQDFGRTVIETGVNDDVGFYW